MPEEFEGDLAGAVFWGADLSGASARRARFLDADLEGAKLFGADLTDAELEA